MRQFRDARNGDNCSRFWSVGKTWHNMSRWLHSLARPGLSERANHHVRQRITISYQLARFLQRRGQKRIGLLTIWAKDVSWMGTNSNIITTFVYCPLVLSGLMVAGKLIQYSASKGGVVCSSFPTFANLKSQA